MNITLAVLIHREAYPESPGKSAVLTYVWPGDLTQEQALERVAADLSENYEDDWSADDLILFYDVFLWYHTVNGANS